MVLIGDASWRHANTYNHVNYIMLALEKPIFIDFNRLKINSIFFEKISESRDFIFYKNDSFLMNFFIKLKIKNLSFYIG